MGRTFDSKNVASSERSAMVSPDATLTPQQAAIQSQPRTHVIRDVGTLESAMRVFYPQIHGAVPPPNCEETKWLGMKKHARNGRRCPGSPCEPLRRFGVLAFAEVIFFGIGV